MRGKKPKEREKYFIRLDGDTLVEVNREIYLEWYRSERRERYQRERDRKHGVCSLEDLKEKGSLFEKDICSEDVTQKTALQNIERDRMRYAFKKLSEQEAWLIVLLYFEEITVREVARFFGCSRKTVENRHKKILRELLAIIDEGEKSKC